MFEKLQGSSKIKMEVLLIEARHGLLNGYLYETAGIIDEDLMAYIILNNKFDNGEKMKVEYFYNDNTFIISRKRKDKDEWINTHILDTMVEVKRAMWSF